MARPVVWREERRRAPLFGSKARRTAVRGSGLLPAMPGGGDVSPRGAIRACRSYCHCGCERDRHHDAGGRQDGINTSLRCHRASGDVSKIALI